MNAPFQHARLPAWPDPEGSPLLAGFERRTDWTPPRVVHVVPSLSLGGAERIVVEVAGALAREGVGTDLVVIRDAAAAHAPPDLPGVRTMRVSHLPWSGRTAAAAAAIRDSGLPGYCHLTSISELRRLWEAGVDTVPVVHNAAGGWQQDPREWDDARVPYAVACGHAVARDLVAAGCRVPVVVIRHVPPRPAPMDDARRSEVRAAFGAGAGTLLLGMTGRLAPQKAHDRAVGVLAELVSRGHDARLGVVGSYEPGSQSHAAAVDAAIRLGVRDRVVFAGPVSDAARLAPAFDLHLNTSLYEGVSIATMEAVLAGVPVVTSDVGGQAEAVGPDDALVPAGAGPGEFADAVEARLRAGRTAPSPAPGWFRSANAALWPWIAAFRSPAFAARGHGIDLLLVTANLDVGGAQRSLGLVAAGLARRGLRVAVAVSGPTGVPDLAAPAIAEGVRFLDLSETPGTERAHVRIGRVLSAALDLKPRALCFWNMDPETKAGVAAAVAGGPVRIAEASPGPALFRELREAAPALACFGTDPVRYLSSLDAFASKYDGGLPPAGSAPPRVAVVRNGVPRAEPLPDGDGPAPPPGCDPALAVLVVGRLNATKKTHLLPSIAARLAERVPGATMTVVGGLHRAGSLPGPLPGNLVLAGPDTRALGFAHRFACLLMLSEEQGCPNASLEALAAGIPVVANDDGGTAEQVVDGVTGALLPASCDADLGPAAVDALAGLLSDAPRRSAMGEAARAHAARSFTLSAMAEGYHRLLLPETMQ